MKKYFTAFCMTQSMFCSIPFPIKKWDEKSRPYMLLFLPFVGLEIGALWLLAHYLLQEWNVPFLIYGFAMCVVTYLITGFIHLDGFMDVCDAVGSYRSLEKRREILKDSHVGSFAVVWCVVLFLAGFVFFASAPQSAPGIVLLFVPVISRVGSALAVTGLKSMSTSQYAQSHTTPKWHNFALVVMAVASVAICFAVAQHYALCLVAQMVVYAYTLRRNYKILDGMNGDISGYCITVSEVFAVAVWALL